MKVFTLLRTLVTYILIFFICLIFIPIALIILLFPEKYRYNNKFLFFIMGIFYKAVVRATLLPVNIKNKSNIFYKKPAIFVVNHQSALDIPVMGYICNGNFHVWLVLEYYANKPILGFFIRRLFISVDKESPIRAAKSLIKVIKFVQKWPRYLIIFPEGGRFIDGKIHDFFEGFAIIAQKTGYPVIPVYLENNGKIYPPGSFLVYYYPINIVIGEPINIEQSETTQEFTQKVYNWFVEQNKQNKIKEK